MRFSCVLCASVIAPVACPRLLSSRSRFARVCVCCAFACDSAFSILRLRRRPPRFRFWVLVFALAFLRLRFLRFRFCACAPACVLLRLRLPSRCSRFCPPRPLPALLLLRFPSLASCPLPLLPSPSSLSPSRLVAPPRPCCLFLLLLPRLRGAGVRAPPVPGCASPKVIWVCGCGCALPKTLTKTQRTLSRKKIFRRS